MKFELPSFKRCCLCIPLRYGLIIWAYIKLIPSFILAVLYGSTIEYSHDDEVVITIILALCIDMAFNILLLVAAHMKNYKLLTAYYYYSIVEMVAFSLLVFVNFFFMLMLYIHCSKIEPCSFGEAMNSLAFLALFGISVLNFMLQFYLVMLVNSEIVKLRSNVVLQFVNVGATLDPKDLKINVTDKKEPHIENQATNPSYYGPIYNETAELIVD